MERNPHWIKVYVSTVPVVGGSIGSHEASARQSFVLPEEAMLGFSPAAEGMNSGQGPSPSTPLVDIHDRHDALVLEADLPGVPEEEIVVELKQNVLKLIARVKRPDLEGARPLALESTASVYERSFILSDEFDRDAISAEFHAGVLTLTLPRNARMPSRRIAVNHRPGHSRNDT